MDESQLAEKLTEWLGKLLPYLVKAGGKVTESLSGKQFLWQFLWDTHFVFFRHKAVHCRITYGVNSMTTSNVAAWNMAFYGCAAIPAAPSTWWRLAVNGVVSALAAGRRMAESNGATGR